MLVPGTVPGWAVRGRLCTHLCMRPTARKWLCPVKSQPGQQEFVDPVYAAAAWWAHCAAPRCSGWCRTRDIAAMFLT